MKVIYLLPSTELKENIYLYAAAILFAYAVGHYSKWHKRVRVSSYFWFCVHFSFITVPSISTQL